MIVGLENLGALCAQIFTRVGIRQVVIIDSDQVQQSNAMESIYHINQVGKKRIDAAKEVLVIVLSLQF